ncbi:MAG: cytochrome c oxidase assembly protein [Rhodospirillum sp.]|nr:cytochrome c oxidase assembly protein [Rhodospirillum sp.]
MSRTDDLARRNARVALICGVTIIGMVGLAFASVPLYRIFCQVTGYGGIPGVDVPAPGAATEGPGAGRIMTVRFNADTDKGLPWHFKPNQKSIDVTLGEQALATFRTSNQGDRPIIGTATFNVTPTKAAQYFSKIQCFCFTEQRLEPGEILDMPVTFYVDPAIAEDDTTSEVTTLTLSYTFFEDTEAEQEAGLPKPEKQAARVGTADQNQRNSRTGG